MIRQGSNDGFLRYSFGSSRVRIIVDRDKAFSFLVARGVKDVKFLKFVLTGSVGDSNMLFETVDLPEYWIQANHG